MSRYCFLPSSTSTNRVILGIFDVKNPPRIRDGADTSILCSLGPQVYHARQPDSILESLSPCVRHGPCACFHRSLVHPCAPQRYSQAGIKEEGAGGEESLRLSDNEKYSLYRSHVFGNIYRTFTYTALLAQPLDFWLPSDRFRLM